MYMPKGIADLKRTAHELYRTQRAQAAQRTRATRATQRTADMAGGIKMSGKWSNEDLRAWMIKADFGDYYEDCGHFTTVLYNGAFTTLTFIKKKDGVSGSEADRPSYAVVSSIRKHFMDRLSGNYFAHEAQMVKGLTREEGNALWQALKSTEWTSKNHTPCYDLGKALDRLPSDSTLKAKFMGA